MKLTPAQRRVLSVFSFKLSRKAHPDYWSRHDVRPIKALLEKGLLRYDVGPYADDWYALTRAGMVALGRVPAPLALP